MPDSPQRTITEQVLVRLRDLILSGGLAPGSRIDQAEMARRFGTSLVPVREALARLQSSGLVRIVPHRGVFVEDLSLDEMIDIYHMREVLEEHAARDAAAHLSDSDIVQLERLVDQMEQLAADGDIAAFLRHTREFHFTIYRAARRRHLLQALQQLWDQSERYRQLQIHLLPGRMREALFENQAILQACRHRDADSLAYMVRYKVHQTTVGLRERMQHASVPVALGLRSA
ncbi:MAG TPA: GntR family transcriptional regulator [Roseiflexaceae bacterium]|nr:GntR family transcriptional regulator [Roseiflexaceae bacterium]HMP39217.1 GntR family transcriptional regulator [Roseiflexaceae bacterium]